MRFRSLAPTLAIVALASAGVPAAAQVMPVLTPAQELGRMLFMEKNLSLNNNQSCVNCHHRMFGFADPRGTAVSEGSVAGQTGTRHSPSAAYAAFSPHFSWDGLRGLYVGGQFWDGRASTLAHQASGPVTNPVEMAMPDTWETVQRLKTATAANPTMPPEYPFFWPDYISAFQAVYGIDLLGLPDPPPPGDPARLAPPPSVRKVYDLMAEAIGELEKSPHFSSFNSKFDYYQAGQVALTPGELRGLQLFRTKGKCVLCHPVAKTIAPDGASKVPPILTDFTYDNLGVPRNMNIPGMAPTFRDFGLGGRPEIAAMDPARRQVGKFKVPTLRNVGLTAPYAHNGVFATLAQVVHFYNTRDVLGACVDNNDPGFGTTCWPAPEVPRNVNRAELGNLGLTAVEEGQIVKFLLTLSDGWGPANGMAPLPRPPMPPSP